MLTFYSSRGAPNPRRVEVFMAEHGLFEGQVRSRSQPSRLDGQVGVPHCPVSGQKSPTAVKSPPPLASAGEG